MSKRRVVIISVVQNDPKLPFFGQSLGTIGIDAASGGYPWFDDSGGIHNWGYEDSYQREMDRLIFKYDGKPEDLSQMSDGSFSANITASLAESFMVKLCGLAWDSAVFMFKFQAIFIDFSNPLQIDSKAIREVDVEYSLNRKKHFYTAKEIKLLD